MAANRTITWSTYYARQREDEGVIQALFETDLGTLAACSRAQHNNAATFTETITDRAFGNALIVPGENGRMHLLHHGFSCLTESEFSLVFVQGNHSDSSYFKILNREAAVEEIRSVVARRASAQQINGPTLASMLATTTADAFANLPAAGNGILRGHPNHVLVKGDLFLMASGAPTVSSSTFAMQIINFLRVIGHDDDDGSSDDESMIAAKKEAAEGAETILAMLWASENARRSTHTRPHLGNILILTWKTLP